MVHQVMVVVDRGVAMAHREAVLAAVTVIPHKRAASVLPTLHLPVRMALVRAGAEVREVR